MEYARTWFGTFLQVPNQLEIIDYSQDHQSKYCPAAKHSLVQANKFRLGQNMNFKNSLLHLDVCSHDDEVFQAVQSVDQQSLIQSFH